MLDGELARDAERAVAAHDDQPVEAHVAHGRRDELDPVDVVEGAATTGAQHGAAAGEHAPHRLDRERQRATLHDTVPGVREAHDLVAVVTFALADDGAEHGVEPGAVAPSGEHSDTHG